MMIRLRAVLIVLSLILLACPGGAQERAKEPVFKGLELYSWPTSEGWRYALMGGTNRLKTWPEVKAAGMKEADLRTRLGKQAVGEFVSWNTDLPDAPAGTLSLPPKATRDGLATLCEGLRLQLFVPK